MVQVVAKPGYRVNKSASLSRKKSARPSGCTLTGKISDWYSPERRKRNHLDRKRDEHCGDESHHGSAPAMKAELVDHEYTGLGPLAPLYNVVGEPAAK